MLMFDKIKRLNSRKVGQVAYHGFFPWLVSQGILTLSAVLFGVGVGWALPIPIAVGVLWGLVASPPLRALNESPQQLALRSAELDEENEKLSEQIYYLDKYGSPWGSGPENLSHHLKTIPLFKQATKKLSTKIVNTIYNRKDADSSDRYL